MQSAVTGLRSRHRSSSVLFALVRFTESAVPLNFCAHTDQSGQGYAKRTPEVTESTPTLLTVLPNCASTIRPGPTTKHYSSSAEFSGGSFTVSSSASQSEQQHNEHSEEDIDDKILLLEASLKFVVSFPFP